MAGDATANGCVGESHSPVLAHIDGVCRAARCGRGAGDVETVPSAAEPDHRSPKDRHEGDHGGGGLRQTAGPCARWTSSRVGSAVETGNPVATGQSETPRIASPCSAPVQSRTATLNTLSAFRPPIAFALTLALGTEARDRVPREEAREPRNEIDKILRHPPETGERLHGPATAARSLTEPLGFDWQRTAA